MCILYLHHDNYSKILIKSISKFSESYLLIFIVLWSGLFLSCDRNSTIDPRMIEAEALISDAPDSALQILEHIYLKEASHINERQKAYLSLLEAKAKTRLGKSFLTDDSFDPSIRYLESISDTLGLIDIYQLAAIKKRWLRQRDSAAYYISKAIDIAPDSSYRLKSELYTMLSNLYAFPTLPKDYQAAEKFAKLALNCAHTPEDRARALHDIGLFYSNQDRNDSAIIYMEKALNEVSPDDSNYDQYILNYASLPNADTQRCVSLLNRIKGQHLGKLITLGFLYLNDSRLDSATYYIAESKKLYKSNPSAYSINTFNNLRLLEQSIGLLKTGIVNCDGATVTNDSISLILDAQHKFSNEQRDYNHRLQVQLLESKARKRLIWIISICILFFVTACLGFYVWYSKRRFLKLKQQLDNVKIEQIVKEATEDVDEKETSMNLIRKRLEICIEQFRISKLQQEIDKMELQYRSSGSFPTIKSRETIQKGLISCFADFIVDLKMTGAKLTVDDIVTCIMVSLKETNTAIGACLGTTETAIRTRKTRLRAKLPPYILVILEI